MSQRILDWVLERYAVGELPEGITADEIAKDPSVPDRLAALQRSNAEFLARLPPRAAAREILRRRESRSSHSRRATWSAIRWAPMLAAVCAVVLLVPRAGPRGPEDELRSKGLRPHLEVYRQQNLEAEVLTPDASVRAGDVLQLRVVGATARFAAVVSIDGTGAVTLHAPEHQGAALALPDSGVQALGHAYALDAAPRFERFVLVTSEQPFDVAVVLSAARALGADPATPLALPLGLRQSSFVVRKEEMP